MRIGKEREMKVGLRYRALIAMLAILPLMVSNAPAEEAKSAPSSSSNIKSVTVYLDRAEVAREALVTLQAGEVELSFGGLPASLDNDSMQVWGSGDASVSLEGVSVEMEPPPEVPKGRVAEIEKQIEELNDKRNLLLEQKKGLEGEIRMLSEVRVSNVENEDGKFIWGDLAEAGKIGTAAAAGIRNAYKEIRGIDKQISDINKQIAALQKELNKIKNPSGERTKCVRINLTVNRPGKMVVNFSYILRGASWVPIYDVRAMPNNGEIEITSHAEIMQRTGEDWNDVLISVSTAKPSVGGNPPELNPIYLNFYYPPPPAKPSYYPGAPMAKSMATPAPMEEAAGAGAMDDEMEADKPEPVLRADVSTAEVRQTGTAVFFEVKQTKTIPSDGEPHRVPIAVDIIKSEFEHGTWPEAKSMAFLRAKTKNTTEHPFVAGKANVFVESTFIGSTAIKDWSVNEEKTISLGVDQGIKIERKEIKRDEKDFGSKRSITYEYNIKATNYKKKSVTLVVYDRMPTTRNGDVEVKIEAFNPEPTEKDDRGILKWRIELKPEQVTEIQISYTVRWPKDRIIIGLP